MNDFSKNALIIGSAVLLTTFASASKTTKSTNTHASQSTYSATGTMSKKTALMLQGLLKNPHLSVEAHIGKHQTKATNQEISYTIKGKTDRATALKLMKLLQTSQQITMTTSAHGFQQTTQLQAMQANKQFTGAYQPFYYNGIPPIFAQGNVVWYPIPVVQYTTNHLIQAPYPMDYTKMFVGK